MSIENNLQNRKNFMRIGIDIDGTITDVNDKLKNAK